jgi:hypothetical protein
MAEEALALGGPSPYGAMPVPPEPRKGLFGGSRPAPGPSPEMMGMTEQLNGIAARIRVSEERFNELRKKMNFIEQNMLANHKKLLGELKSSNEEIDETRHKLAEVEDRVITIIKELRLTARKTDMDVMRRYIEFWDPVKFVNGDQVEKIVKEILEEQGLLIKDDQNI